jgi:hypothetical protein
MNDPDTDDHVRQAAAREARKLELLKLLEETRVLIESGAVASLAVFRVDYAGPWRVEYRGFASRFEAIGALGAAAQAIATSF